MLVASAPGGPSDLQIRLLVPVKSEVMGQTLIVDNRPSANGVLATGIASKANPDGHTFTVGNSGTHAVNATLYRKLAYDPIRDFAPVSQFSTTGGSGANFVVAWQSDSPASLPLVEGVHANLPAARSIAFITTARPIPPE
jgi:tripartite-type tricarboxylate transporter receptor subunit TctC